MIHGTGPRFARILAILHKLALLAGLSGYLLTARAQEQELSRQTSDASRHDAFLLPAFYPKDSLRGSPYLVSGWLRGFVRLTDSMQLPAAGHPLLFNFNKLNQHLYATDTTKKVWHYSSDSIAGFSLIDSNSNIYTFEKLPLINDRQLLQTMVSSPTGYSVYRRVFTKFIPGNFENAGYYSTGKNYDRYLDYYHYYLVYPGRTRFTKLKLTVHAIKKALPAESQQVNAFFSNDSGPVNEKTFLLLIRSINEKH